MWEGDTVSRLKTSDLIGKFHGLGLGCGVQAVQKAEPLDGPLMQRYCQLARETGVWLSLGGFQERGPDPDHLYNCHVIVTAAGEIAAKYRKVHLFNVDVPNGPVLMESRSTAPGNEVGL